MTQAADVLPSHLPSGAFSFQLLHRVPPWHRDSVKPAQTVSETRGAFKVSVKHDTGGVLYLLYICQEILWKGSLFRRNITRILTLIYCSFEVHKHLRFKGLLWYRVFFPHFPRKLEFGNEITLRLTAIQRRVGNKSRKQNGHSYSFHILHLRCETAVARSAEQISSIPVNLCISAARSVTLEEAPEAPSFLVRVSSEAQIALNRKFNAYSIL